ncbi:hypothetical protein DUI87_03132 [Hirundo rustica rustica]|uniref:Uncharacterized protein n=1 Tax=Hirundo rustica rustica TaxID=333673 RepID=A0A3M0L6I3_HIRRU|nr:hypothetical protein DUI87_03132 [Hirundo rustica rustica]
MLDVNWEHQIAGTNKSRRFLRNLDDNFMEEVLRELTRKDALLDLLLVNREGLVREVEIGNCLGHSNHKAIEFKISVDRRKSASKTSTLDMMRKDFGLLRELDKDGHLTNRDMEKADMFNDFFASVFNTNERLTGSQCPELRDHGCENYQLSVDPEVLKDLLFQLDPYKFMRPDGIHTRILKELADKDDPGNYKPVSLTSMPGKVMEIILGVIEKCMKDNAVIGHSQYGFMRGKSCLSNVIYFYGKGQELDFDEPCCGDQETCPEDWKKANVTLVFKKGKREDTGNYSLTSISGKVMEQLILEATSKHMEDKVISSQHGFNKGTLCLTNLIAFYDWTTGWIDVRKGVDIVYLDFSKAFDTVSHDILIGNLRKHGLDE